jgi:ornithine carbamoyltransferase
MDVSFATTTGAGPADADAPRDLLSIWDLPEEDVIRVCQRAICLKHAARVPQTLRGAAVGVYFRKSSTRTRTSFTVGAGRLGATVIGFGPDDLQTTTGETLEDTARVLAGYLRILVMRTNASVREMRTFAAHPTMSVINALSDDEHPSQALADLTTMLEHFGRLDGVSLLYCGAGNKTAASLALAMSRIAGTHVTFATPAGHGLDPRTLGLARAQALQHGARIEETHDPGSIPRGVDVVYTSRWREMGVSPADPAWRTHFEPFRVTRALFDRVSGPRTVFMHDLPAVRGEDVDGEVLDGPRSLAWVQAQHKLFSAMSLLEWCHRALQS